MDPPSNWLALGPLGTATWVREQKSQTPEPASIPHVIWTSAAGDANDNVSENEESVSAVGDETNERCLGGVEGSEARVNDVPNVESAGRRFSKLDFDVVAAEVAHLLAGLLSVLLYFPLVYLKKVEEVLPHVCFNLEYWFSKKSDTYLVWESMCGYLSSVMVASTTEQSTVIGPVNLRQEPWVTIGMEFLVQRVLGTVLRNLRHRMTRIMTATEITVALENEFLVLPSRVCDVEK
ncbi:hypothetical protein BJ742DRAFT_739957 [Cladochytrium replicatum]|nr:hypothetical protein BJ742DRAFT_739957 [Cladochytrium replicatum]